MKEGKELQAGSAYLGVSILSALETAHRATATLIVIPDLAGTLARPLTRQGLILPPVQQGGLPSSDMLWFCGPFSKHRTRLGRWERGQR